MGIIKSYLVPHPPLIIPDVGRGSENQIDDIIKSYDEVGIEISNINPETIIIVSPHAPTYIDYFHISPNNTIKGSFAKFNASNVKFEEEIDTELVEKIENISKKYNFPAGKGNECELDHASMVPLYFIRKYLPKCKIVVIGFSFLSLIENYKMGTIIREAVEDLNRKVVFIASGDLSHRLQEDGPYGYAEEGSIYEKRILDTCYNKRFNELIEYDEVFLEKAAECGHRSITVMAGIFDGYDVDTNFYSHEDITGVGYSIMSFTPRNKDDSRLYLEKYLQREKERVISIDEYVNLAKKAITEYIKNNNIIEIPYNTSKELLENKAGVFVSIHKFNKLRGCIGTFIPTKENIAEEIIKNAISASSEDSRFPKIEKDELDYLEINVDVLSTPEDIDNKNLLNPKKYGVIVSSGYKRGLLLPDLDGVEDIDTQIRIAKEKAGIIAEEIKLQRFEVIRHK